MKPIRRAAGKVRDMDVISAKVIGMAFQSEKHTLVRLTEHIGEMRMKASRKLLHQVGKQQPATDRSLQQHANLIEKVLPKSTNGNSAASAHMIASALSLVEELAEWPALTEDNLHPFRLRVKALRYLLLLDSVVKSKFADTLGEVKDQIGEWHDWLELSKIAREVLDPRHDRKTLEHIRAIEKKKLQQALASANTLRETYLNRHGMDGLKKISQSFRPTSRAAKHAS